MMLTPRHPLSIRNAAEPNGRLSGFRLPHLTAMFARRDGGLVSSGGARFNNYTNRWRRNATEARGGGPRSCSHLIPRLTLLSFIFHLKRRLLFTKTLNHFETSEKQLLPDVRFVSGCLAFSISVSKPACRARWQLRVQS